jgi:vancomycin resistance protein YoaR
MATVLAISTVAVPTGIAYAADIAGGVTVAGVDLGGRSTAGAARLLRARLAERMVKPVPVTIGGVSAAITPQDAGLVLDADATAAAAAKVRPAPWTALFGTRRVDPVVSVDVDKLAALVQPHVGTQGFAPVWPAIRYAGLEPDVTRPVAGRGVDRRTAAATVRRNWLRADRIDLPITDVVPDTTAADLDRMLADLARPAVAAPVIVTVEAPPAAPVDLTVTPAAIAAGLTFEPDADGRVTPRIDAAKLRQAIGPGLAAVDTAATDATFTVQDGQPVAVPAVDGRAVDLDAAAGRLLDVLGRPSPRRVSTGVVPVPAARTGQGLRDLGIVGLVSTFTTRFQAGQPRTTNIRIVADLARGVIVPAGGTFSLNDLTGDRTLAKGYVMAPVIENGKIKNAPGGGISQFATTAFNAGYYAGMVDVAHRPHSYHFDRYPAVIEATTVYPTLDMAWRNDSPHAVLVDAVWTPTSITVSLFGTKRFDIETVYGPRTNHSAPATVPLNEADCNPTDGIPGFRQEAWRVFKQDGREVKRERFVWHYRAEPRFVCG